MAVLPRLRHAFDLSFPEARALQERLSGRVLERELRRPLRRVAGVDVYVIKANAEQRAEVETALRRLCVAPDPRRTRRDPEAIARGGPPHGSRWSASRPRRS